MHFFPSPTPLLATTIAKRATTDTSHVVTAFDTRHNHRALGAWPGVLFQPLLERRILQTFHEVAAIVPFLSLEKAFISLLTDETFHIIVPKTIRAAHRRTFHRMVHITQLRLAPLRSTRSAATVFTWRLFPVFVPLGKWPPHVVLVSGIHNIITNGTLKGLVAGIQEDLDGGLYIST